MLEWAGTSLHRPVVRFAGSRLSDSGDLNYLNLQFSKKEGNIPPNSLFPNYFITSY